MQPKRSGGFRGEPRDGKEMRGALVRGALCSFEAREPWHRFGQNWRKFRASAAPQKGQQSDQSVKREYSVGHFEREL
jgi:hypothetical protein